MSIEWFVGIDWGAGVHTVCVREARRGHVVFRRSVRLEPDLLHGWRQKAEPHKIATLADVEAWLADFEGAEGNTLALMSEPRI